jgi:hypothetical protein
VTNETIYSRAPACKAFSIASIPIYRTFFFPGSAGARRLYLPRFNLGAKYAFELFGTNWDANLYFSAIFACLTFLWIYWLMALLSMGRVASLLMAFAIECAAMLTLCFSWYNNSVFLLAAIFFSRAWPMRASLDLRQCSALTFYR